MTPRLALLLMIAAGMCGCGIQGDDVARPISLCGDVIVNVHGCEYIKADVYGGYTYTHLGNCTNHAPVVVTNTVTNECKYCAWARSKTNAVEGEQ